MKRNHLASVSGLVLFVAVLFACNYSSAHLGSLKVGKDRAVSQESNSFAPSDAVYAVATVSNAPGKVKVKGQLVIEDVPGQKPGPVPNLEKTLDLDGSGNATFSFTPPPSGWPTGKYKIEVTMTNDKGEQKDQKTASFSVS
ncbi:MAG TPA: hypothetical protein VN696_13580 [Pyrinomonadaceae bacterium]|nr:hypothetical protein [Pyrinomonadaceae bacterium]